MKTPKSRYVVQNRHEIHDELCIQNLKGEDVLVLPVTLRVDDVLAQYNRLRRILGEAQHAVMQNPEDEAALASYGTVVIALFEVIFGADGVKKLTDYYGERYGEMLEDVAPFIVDRIQPQFEVAMKARIKNYRKLAAR